MRETKYWTWFILAGIVILFLGGLHMMTVHLNGVAGIFNPVGYDAVDWRNVAYRGRSLFFTLTYIILLGAVLYHGFYGLRTMLLELGLQKPTERKLTASLWVIGIILFAIGTFAAFAAKTAATNL
jgi:succinate dehydrogenase/fumarate reductase cytochrome b subunit